MNAAKTVTATFTMPKPLLSVFKLGNGSGTITGSGIDCGATCQVYHDYDTSVSLTAIPAVGSTFTGWSSLFVDSVSVCSGTGTCNFTMDTVKDVAAIFTLQQYTLTVDKSGSGSGTVAGGNINCGATCASTLNYGATVSLMATPAVGSTFVGWSGACSGTGACNVTIDTAKNVTATFALQQYTLSVNKSGTGSGTVAGNGIDCGATCSATLDYGTSVALSATPASDSTFSGWSGACSGTEACNVTMDAAKTVAATFVPIKYTLSVSKTNGSYGSVTSSPAGINCGTVCSAQYNQGTSVALTATPIKGHKFTGWSGACTGTSTNCTVPMNQNRSVTAIFK